MNGVRIEALAPFIALVAGYLDAVVWLKLHLWVANMNGAAMFFGIYMVQGDVPKAWQHGISMVTFASGVTAARLVRKWADRWPGAAMALPAALVAGAIPVFPSVGSFFMLCFATGAVNGAITRFGGVTVNTAFITGDLAKLGEDLSSPKARKGAGLLGAVILVYTGGAFLGALAHAGLPEPIFPAAVGLFIVAALVRRDRQPRAAPPPRSPGLMPALDLAASVLALWVMARFMRREE